MFAIVMGAWLGNAHGGQTAFLNSPFQVGRISFVNISSSTFAALAERDKRPSANNIEPIEINARIVLSACTRPPVGVLTAQP
jgi:hypothetical protein